LDTSRAERKEESLNENRSEKRERMSSIPEKGGDELKKGRGGKEGRGKLSQTSL